MSQSPLAESDPRRPTREECIAAAGAAIAASIRRQNERTVAEAARAAYTPGGPSLAELERRIAARRAIAQAAASDQAQP